MFGARGVAVGLLRLEGSPDAPRTLRRIWLAGEIADVHKESGGTYGALRVTPSSVRRGISVGHNAVSDIMRQLGLKGLPRRRLPRGAKLSGSRRWISSGGSSAAIAPTSCG